MPDWRGDYLANLQEAERNNPVNKDLVAACSQLADRVASLQAENALLQRQQAPSSPAIAKTSANETAGTTEELTAQLRFDLAEALRSKGQLQARFKATDTELQKLRTKNKVDEKRIRDLTMERNALTSKLKDRNEELLGKNKLLKDVQDENLTLNIQIDVTEQKAAKVAAENKELIDRWMRRMAQEADAMNLANEPRPRHGR